MEIRLSCPNTEQEGEELDHVLAHFRQAHPVVQRQPAHQPRQAGQVAAAAAAAVAAATAVAALLTAQLQQAVQQGGPHGRKVPVIVGITEQVEEDGLEEGESCGGLFGRWLVEKPEALVQNQAPGRWSGPKKFGKESAVCG